MSIGTDQPHVQRHKRGGGSRGGRGRGRGGSSGRGGRGARGRNPDEEPEVPCPFNGFLVIDKPTNVTSNDVVGAIRTRLGKLAYGPSWRAGRRSPPMKIGHGGTLDPLATGVLVLGIGTCTKLLSKFLASGKEYEATGVFGSGTDTYDSAGEVVATGATDHITPEKIEEALVQFRGDIMQKPPIYSALRVDGKHMYELAREGRADHIEIAARPVTLYSLELLSFDPETKEFKLSMSCSSGTYVRSIIHDLGEALQTHAHMTGLARTGQGIFRLDKGDGYPLQMWSRGDKAVPSFEEKKERLELKRIAEEAKSVVDVAKAAYEEAKVVEGASPSVEGAEVSMIATEQPKNVETPVLTVEEEQTLFWKDFDAVLNMIDSNRNRVFTEMAELPTKSDKGTIAHFSESEDDGEVATKMDHDDTEPERVAVVMRDVNEISMDDMLD